MREALERLGNPERSYPHILVAGTNGKGSTCVFLEGILREMGFHVGTNISPHVTHFCERFRIDGSDADEEELSRIRRGVSPTLDGIELTYFEWCVVLAAVLFKHRSVDYAVFEIGLGGRFDAANALDPAVCLITDISLDHTRHLGSTVEQIALEKAGIARRGRALLTTAGEPAAGIIHHHACLEGALFQHVTGPSVHIPRLKGSRQPMNAALAVAGARALGLDPGPEVISRALSSACLPGRIEELGGRIILDVAHNPAAMEELIKHLDETGFHGVGVFGVLADKDYASMITMLKEVCSRLFMAPVRSERSWTLQEMEGFLDADRAVGCVSITEAFLKALYSGENIVVTGSFFTVGEVRELIVCAG